MEVRRFSCCSRAWEFCSTSPSRRNSMRAVLAGGGTGGHVIPALAIAKELQNLYQAERLFIGTARGMETRLVPAAGYPLELIKVGQLNRVSLATRVRTLVDLPMSVVHSARLLGKFRPQV